MIVDNPADESEVRKALETAVVGGFDFVVTIGGTGVGPRDITPEVTEPALRDRRRRTGLGTPGRRA